LSRYSQIADFASIMVTADIDLPLVVGYSINPPENGIFRKG
jgi:hypothetical protein